MKKIDSTKRFSDRVENYIKYRPSYPSELISELKRKGIITDTSVIADIGSGTGIFTKLLLTTDCLTYAVEPNDEMRYASEKLLSEKTNFRSQKGTAEDTNLADNSINLITVAQAFHWFDAEKTRKEFIRILKEPGYVALIWNTRILKTSFQNEYNTFLANHCPEYSSPDHLRYSDEGIENFFKNKVEYFSCENFQVFNFEGLKGRVLSSSYALKEGQEGYEQFIEDLFELYNKYQINNQVKFDYQTDLYYGRLK
ncbi:MAG: class I SAM-dependent methyltransferase [Candidatus Thorarchaeota archaeon]